MPDAVFTSPLQSSTCDDRRLLPHETRESPIGARLCFCSRIAVPALTLFARPTPYQRQPRAYIASPAAVARPSHQRRSVSAFASVANNTRTFTGSTTFAQPSQPTQSAMATMATMDAKTLHSTGKQITKAIESGDSAEGLLNLLQPLSKWTATEDLLRQSKIGVIVSKLRQQKDPKVVEQASKLVNKWKSDVNASKKKSSSSPAPSSAASKASAAANGRSSGTSSPAPAAAAVKKEKEQPKKSTADPAKRNSNVDGISTAVTGNQTRDSCVKLMYDGLAFMSEEGKNKHLASFRGLITLTKYSSGGSPQGGPQRRASSLQHIPA